MAQNVLILPGSPPRTVRAADCFDGHLIFGCRQAPQAACLFNNCLGAITGLIWCSIRPAQKMVLCFLICDLNMTMPLLSDGRWRLGLWQPFSEVNFLFDFIKPIFSHYLWSMLLLMFLQEVCNLLETINAFKSNLFSEMEPGKKNQVPKGLWESKWSDLHGTIDKRDSDDILYFCSLFYPRGSEGTSPTWEICSSVPFHLHPDTSGMGRRKELKRTQRTTFVGTSQSPDSEFSQITFPE